MRRKICLASSSCEIASSDSMSCSHSPSISPVQRPASAKGYGLLRSRSFQGLDELLELGLVREGDLEPVRDDAAGESGDPVGSPLRPGDERGIELRLLAALFRLR